MPDISDVMYISPSYGLSSRGFTIDAEMFAITLEAFKFPMSILALRVAQYSPRLP